MKLYKDIDTGFISQCVAHKSVSVDIETSGLDWKHDRIGTIQLFATDTHYRILQPDVTPTHLAKLMSDINVLKIFHHATFDITFLAQKYSLDVNNIHCTKVAEKILFPLNNPDFYSLKSIHKRYLGIEINKSLQKSDWLAKNLSDDQICYALQDVIHLEDIQKEQTSRLAKEGKEMLMKRCMDFLTTRVTLDCTGAGDVFKY